MDSFDEAIKFANRKQRLLLWLSSGIAVKSEWDNLICEAHSLGYLSSEAQLKRYYDHYKIGFQLEGKTI